MALAVAVVGVVGTAPAAQADPDGGTTPGFEVGLGRVQVTLTGDVDPGASGGGGSTVPAACYWTRPDLGSDPSDTTAWAAEFRELAGVSATALTPGGVGDSTSIEESRRRAALPNGLQSLDDAVAADAVGDVRWWMQSLGSYEGAYQDAWDAGCATRSAPTPFTPFYAYDYFTVPPEPKVDVDVLVDYAFTHLLLPDPRLNWNPKINGLGNATLVNLPTWIWVSDDDAVGELEITATTPGLSVTLSATPERSTVTSAARGPACTMRQLRQPYRAGVDPSKGCTLTFPRASRTGGPGFGVETTVVWSGRYEASDGRSGDLGTRTITSTTTIPVAQSQAVVTEVD